MDLAGVNKLFENLLNENPYSKKELERVIYPVRSGQYKKEI
jgi:hypothetical protein